MQPRCPPPAPQLAGRRATLRVRSPAGLPLREALGVGWAQGRAVPGDQCKTFAGRILKSNLEGKFGTESLSCRGSQGVASTSTERSCAGPGRRLTGSWCEVLNLSLASYFFGENLLRHVHAGYTAAACRTCAPVVNRVSDTHGFANSLAGKQGAGYLEVAVWRPLLSRKCHRKSRRSDSNSCRATEAKAPKVSLHSTTSPVDKIACEL